MPKENLFRKPAMQNFGILKPIECKTSAPVSFISSPEEYYFILRDYHKDSKGYDADDKASK